MSESKPDERALSREPPRYFTKAGAAKEEVAYWVWPCHKPWVQPIGRDGRMVQKILSWPDTLADCLLRVDNGTFWEIAAIEAKALLESEEKDETATEEEKAVSEPKAGDVVRLKSGGPNMTYGKEQDGKGRVRCDWFTCQQIAGFGFFLQDSLRVVGGLPEAQED